MIYIVARENNQRSSLVTLTFSHPCRAVPSAATTTGQERPRRLFCYLLLVTDFQATPITIQSLNVP